MSDLLTRQDIVNCYRLALGRDPESEGVIEDKLAQPRSGLLPDFFSSAEFDGVRTGVLQVAPPQVGLRSPPTEDMRLWTSKFAPLSTDGAAAVQAASTWPGLFRALFADPIFVTEVLNEDARARNVAFVAALMTREQVETATGIEGKVELVTPFEVRGWAVDRGQPSRSLRLELWVDDVFRAAAITHYFRPELQECFGGSGMFGFAIARPLESHGAGSLRAELREARSGAIVSIFRLGAVPPPPIDAAVALRRELAEVHSLLVRIEQRLPDLNEAYSFDLDLYGDYYEAFCSPRLATVTKASPFRGVTVVVDIRQASLADLTAALTDLAGQTRPPSHVVVLTDSKLEASLDVDYALSLWRGRFEDPASPRRLQNDGGWFAAMKASMAATGTTHIVVFEAWTRLAVEAIEQVAHALQGGAALVYADSDEVDLLGNGVVGRHRAPAFRTAFDADLFLQQGDLGPLVGLSAHLGELSGGCAERQADGLYALGLEYLNRYDTGGIVHIARVLSHATAPPPAGDMDARHDALTNFLAASRSGAEVLFHSDVLGATLPGALRVRRPLAAATRVAVVVPTRDRLDLLEPCLDSLVATMEHNRAKIEILLVDNQSQDPATFAFLERFVSTYPSRVIAHESAFNWALMNNRAAAETQAEVLIFLNNDTAALSPDWCDELCSQALRPDVGAVGARLVYADGAIQHAGVVIGGWHAFAAHEGVGAPGLDPGYRGRHALLRQVSAVTGACLATRRSTFIQFGGFDAISLPVESNDIDYCLRLRSADMKVIYDPYCTFYHFESRSRGLNTDLAKWKKAEAAGQVMRARWGEAYCNDPFYNPHFDRLSDPLTRLAPLPAPNVKPDRPKP